jgi:hypothetical protein
MTKPESPDPAVLDLAALQALRDAIDHVRSQMSPEDHARLTDMVEVMSELRVIVSEADDDAPADETLLALAIERARARRSSR